MHVDGGINGPLFVAPEAYLFAGAGRRLPAANLYIIVNGRLAPEFLSPPRATVAILGRSITMALQMGARIDLLLAFQAAQRDNVGFNLAYVPSNFDQKAKGLFDPAYMNALYDKGFAAGQNGNAFEKTLPFRRPPGGSDAKAGEQPAEKK